MDSLSNQCKKRLNILIPYYRRKKLEETKEGMWQQGWFYKDEQTGLSICSSKIYCALEKNTSLVHDEIYFFAANKLSLIIHEKLDVEAEITKLVDKLCTSLTYKSEKESIELLERITKITKKYEQFVYFHELNIFMELLKRYLQDRNQLMSEADFQMFNEIEGIFEGNIHELVLYYLYIYANYHEDSKIQKVLEKYDYENSSFIPNRIFAVTTYEQNHAYLQAIFKYQELEKVLTAADNQKQLVYIYLSIANLLHSYDREQLLNYVNKAIQIVDTVDFSNQQKWLILMNLGTISILSQQYEFSRFCLEKAMKLSDKLLLRCAICLIHCYRCLHIPIPPYLYDYSSGICFGDKIEKIIYQYFLEEEKRDNHANREYILRKIAPILHAHEELYIGIIKRELELLCKEINSYKSLYEFEAKIGKKKR